MAIDLEKKAENLREVIDRLERKKKLTGTDLKLIKSCKAQLAVIAGVRRKRTAGSFVKQLNPAYVRRLETALRHYKKLFGDHAEGAIAANALASCRERVKGGL